MTTAAPTPADPAGQSGHSSGPTTHLAGEKPTDRGAADRSAAPPGPAARPSVRPLAGLLTATLLALTGTRVSAIALPWFALITTGSPALTGVVVFCEMAPYVVVKTLAGPIVDRIGARLTSWTTDLGSAFVAALVPACYLLGLLPFWWLLVLVALLGAVRGPADLAKQVMVPEAADRCAVPLERATGLSGATERFASTVGPLLGGGLIALIGPVAGLMVNGTCFLLCAVLVITVLPSSMGRQVPDETAASPGVSESGEAATPPQPEGYWRRLRVGATFLYRERLLLLLTATICVTNLLDAAFSSVLLPVWAERGGGPMAIAWIGATLGATAIAGSVLASVFGHRIHRYPIFVAGMLLVGLPRYLVLAADAPLWAVLVVIGIGGFGAGFVNPVVSAVIFERIPRPLLGRVTSLFSSLAWAGIPLGGLVGGLAIDGLGLVPALVGCGVLYFLVIVVVALRPVSREMDAGRGPAVPRAGRAGDSASASAGDGPDPDPAAATAGVGSVVTLDTGASGPDAGGVPTAVPTAATSGAPSVAASATHAPSAERDRPG